MKQPFRHLRRRRILVWALSLILIAALGGAIGGIFWSVRMKTAYRTELVPVEERIFLASVPLLPLQVFREGDPVSFRRPDGEESIGTLLKAYAGTESMELRLELPGLPEEKVSGEVTLRSQRLLAAFIYPSPDR